MEPFGISMFQFGWPKNIEQTRKKKRHASIASVNKQKFKRMVWIVCLNADESCYWVGFSDNKANIVWFRFLFGLVSFWLLNTFNWKMMTISSTVMSRCDASTVYIPSHSIKNARLTYSFEKSFDHKLFILGHECEAKTAQTGGNKRSISWKWCEIYKKKKKTRNRRIICTCSHTVKPRKMCKMWNMHTWTFGIGNWWNGKLHTATYKIKECPFFCAFDWTLTYYYWHFCFCIVLFPGHCAACCCRFSYSKSIKS